MLHYVSVIHEMTTRCAYFVTKSRGDWIGFVCNSSIEDHSFTARTSLCFQDLLSSAKIVKRQYARDSKVH